MWVFGTGPGLHGHRPRFSCGAPTTLIRRGGPARLTESGKFLRITGENFGGAGGAEEQWGAAVALRARTRAARPASRARPARARGPARPPPARSDWPSAAPPDSQHGPRAAWRPRRRRGQSAAPLLREGPAPRPMGRGFVGGGAARARRLRGARRRCGLCGVRGAGR